MLTIKTQSTVCIFQVNGKTFLPNNFPSICVSIRTCKNKKEEEIIPEIIEVEYYQLAEKSRFVFKQIDMLMLKFSCKYHCFVQSQLVSNCIL